jgi:hypothetical protein
VTKKTGQCLCGRTTFTLTDDNPTVAICHCTHCQKQTGSAFSIVTISPRDRFVCAGPLKKFNDIGESGGAVSRWFCAECGSPILTEAAAMAGAAIVKAGCFDDTSWLKPSLQIYCDSRQEWAPLAEGTANFAKTPA